MIAIRRMCALALASAWCFGCSSSDNGAVSEDAGGADVTTPTADSSMSNPDSSTATETIGTAGGTVSAQGIDLTIPAGALPANTTITITRNAGSVPAGYTALSALYAFGPDGTVFLKPITVSFALGSGGTNPTVYWSNANGGYDALATTVVAGSASASVTHFSTGFVAAGMAVADGGTDATVTPDATAADGAPSGDATASSDDSSAPSDAGAPPTDAPAADSAATDAAVADSAVADSAVGDGGINGISVKVDNVATVFASSPSATNLNGIAVVQANDNASSTHWQLQIEVMPLQSYPQQEACSPSLAYPRFIYTHFTAGVADQVFNAETGQGICELIVSSEAAGTGQVTSGQIFSASVFQPNDAGSASHTFGAGTFSVTE